MTKKYFFLCLMLPVFASAKKEETQVVSQDIPKADFTVPSRIQNDVDFWAKVYREWDTNQVVFYDSPTKIVLDVLDLPTVLGELSSSKYRKDVEKRFKQVTEVLKTGSSAIKNKDTDFDADKVLRVAKAHGLLTETNVVNRLRSQNGLRSQFEAGLIISGRYTDEIKSVLKRQNLPEELLAIVFVESLFNLSAVSHAGASGPWGIVKETALQSGIHVNNFTDERLDWVLATYSAALYLKRAIEGLSLWSLAITSYNYGYPGMKRAANIFGNDFEAILDNHQSPIFGYASKSYYAEFLAALDTLQNQDKYFPNLKKEERCLYDVVQIQRPLEVPDVLALGVFKEEDFKRLNPALTKRTINGYEVLPANYAFRIPQKKSNLFYSQLKKISNQQRKKASEKISVKHRVRRNETLSSIAKMFGIKEDYLSERFAKPLNYKPKGTVLIRSEAHKFSPLLELNQTLLTNLGSSTSLKKPPEISAAK